MNLKRFILGLALFAILGSITVCEASVSDSSIKDMIGQYKAQNYTGCLQMIDLILSEDPSNIYAHYYQALAYSQLGDKDKAIASFEKVESLNSNQIVVNYATKGKACLVSEDACKAYDKSMDALDEFINSNKFYDKSVQKEMNKKKLNRMREDINKNLKEASSEKKSDIPSNDEIAEAVKTLAKVGFNPMSNANNMFNMYQTPEMMQASMLLGNNDNNNGMNSMLPYFLMNQGQNGNNQISPELIQTMMMSQMQMY